MNGLMKTQHRGYYSYVDSNSKAMFSMSWSEWIHVPICIEQEATTCTHVNNNLAQAGVMISRLVRTTPRVCTTVF